MRAEKSPAHGAEMGDGGRCRVCRILRDKGSVWFIGAETFER
ncbi:hypothetical protein HMPREF7215_1031 [Pyramidobacter piscolens W5455]|uniref:Uncharacterized protein n=1 Tax=Pyramidobacter piscolens W5455 TaxID=352165 RepID=A0ABM9ZS08_9BACT|nr:hypothetical protein HMPREF7215_1031 [Pyramidobacter piscolens W5455]